MATKHPRGGFVLDEFTSENTPRYSPVCTFCKWWKPADGRSCAAFPAKNTIPIGIWVGRNDASTGYRHTRHVPGDHGILFELAPGAEAGARKAGLIP